MSIDYSLRNYFTALRSMRSAPTEQQRADVLKGTVKLTALTEKDPRLRARLQATITQEEQRRPA